MAVKIIKAKDRKPSKAELVFDWLLETGGIAKGFNGGAQRIEITLEDNGIEFLISVHLHGKSTLAFFCSNTDRGPAIKHLAYLHAEIPREPKPSLTASFRRIVSDLRPKSTNGIRANYRPLWAYPETVNR